MAETVLGGFKNVTVTNAFFAWPLNGANATATESFRQWPVRVAGSFDRYTINIDNVGTARKSVIRRNGADSSVTISPADGASGSFKSWGTPQHYAVADTFDLENIVTGTGFTLITYSLVFNADAGTVGYAATQFVSIAPSSTAFSSLGSNWVLGADTSSKITVRAPFTAQNMIATVQTNSLTASTSVVSRKNGAAGAGTLTIGAGATGAFEDTTHTDSLASGDTFGFSAVTTAGGTSIAIIVGCTLNYTSQKSEVVGGGATFNFNASPQFVTALNCNTSGLTELSCLLAINGVLSAMRFNVFSNTNTGTWTLTVRKNGVNGSQTLSVGATTTGNFEDTTHTDTISETDSITYTATGGTSGTIVTSVAAMTITPIDFTWYQPLSTPVRQWPPVPVGAKQFLAFDPLPLVSFGWFAPLSEPVRTRPGLKAGEVPFLAYIDNPITVTPFAWFVPLSEPVRSLPGLKPSQQQFRAYIDNPITVTPFAWYAPLSEPVRFRQGLAAARQQFLAAPSQLRPTPAISGVLSAIETKDTMLAGARIFNRLTSAEIGIVDLQPIAAEIGIHQAGTAGAIASVRISINIV
jgi:hypothetical protein